MRILLVDDEALSRKAISDFLSNQLGHQFTQCQDGLEALKIYKKKPFHLVISDIRMPGCSGIELLQKIKTLASGRMTDVILITGFGDIHSAIQALRAGAYDYLLKPIEVEELAIIVDRASEHQALLLENRELRDHFEEKVEEATTEIKEALRELKDAYSRVAGTGRVVIFSPKMKQLREMAEKFHQDRTIPVLIEGETGTGKEIFARLIHYGDGETTSPFIALNCSAISGNLFETELFGYDEGAFTDAKRRGSTGKMELAQGGTLFLDEIGDLPFDIQPKLLRVIEERQFYRVGGLKKIKLDIRIICATNQDLEKKISQGTFRRDLYYRLNVGQLYIPSLKNRPEEIEPLAKLFMQEFSEQKKRRFQRINPEALKILSNHPWPGNVRELQNAIERIILLYDDTEIRSSHLAFLGTDGDDLSEKNPVVLQADNFRLPDEKLDLKRFEREIVREVLKKFNQNKTKAADFLGLTRSALRSKLK